MCGGDAHADWEENEDVNRLLFAAFWAWRALTVLHLDEAERREAGSVEAFCSDMRDRIMEMQPLSVVQSGAVLQR